MKKPENDFKQNINKALDDSLDSLPNSVKAKLAASRQKALLIHKEQMSKQPLLNQEEGHWHKPMWAIAASVCLMLPLWYAVNTTNSPLPLQSTSLTSVDIMFTLAELDDDEMEVVDNLEFALWLSEQGANG